jgi:hypothetical protein
VLFCFARLISGRGRRVRQDRNSLVTSSDTWIREPTLRKNSSFRVVNGRGENVEMKISRVEDSFRLSCTLESMTRLQRAILQPKSASHPDSEDSRLVRSEKKGVKRGRGPRVKKSEQGSSRTAEDFGDRNDDDDRGRDSLRRYRTEEGSGSVEIAGRVDCDKKTDTKRIKLNESERGGRSKVSVCQDGMTDDKRQ